MKKRVFSIIAGVMAIVLTLGLTACGGSSSPAPATTAAASAETTAAAAPKTDDKVYEVRLSCDTLDISNMTIYLQKFASRAEEISGGKLSFTVYTAGTLYSSQAGLEATQRGDLEMCLCSAQHVGAIDPEVLVLGLPFILPNKEAVLAAYHGPLTEHAFANIGKYNLELLDVFVFCEADMSSNKEIHVPDDIKGMKIRAYGPANASLLTACGAAPTMLSGGEVTQSLSSKMIDGALCGTESMVDRKYYDFQTNNCAVGVDRADYPVMMNKEWWDSLPEEIQGYITQAMEDIIYDEIDSAFEKETEAREQMDSLGMKCYYPTDEEMELWYEKANEVYEEYRDSIGGSLIDEAIALRDQYK